MAAGDQWRTIELPFATFEAVARGQRAGAAWDGDDLLDLTIRASRDGGERVWFEIDNVQFF
ncbi:hypothetical protein D3C80_845040 [compost metagenome]